MTPLCITADDYGLHAGINASVESLARLGAINAVSVMVHRGAALGSVRSLLETRVATGLHLTLVAERPLLGSRLAPLLDDEGLLPSGYASLFARILRRPGLLPLLRQEVLAQVGRYLETGLPLDFVNSHQHVHLFPPVWWIIGDVLRAHPRAAVRTAYAQRLGLSRQGALGLSSRLAWRLRPQPRRQILHPIGVDFAGAMTLDEVDRALGRLDVRGDAATRVHELVAHPGFPDPGAAPRHLAWGYSWEREHGILASVAFQSLLERRRMHPTSPRDVAH